MTRQQSLIVGLIAVLTLAVGVLATLVLTREPPTRVYHGSAEPFSPADERLFDEIMDQPIEEDAEQLPGRIQETSVETPAADPALRGDAERFVAEYLARQSEREANPLIELYADGVRFYGLGRVDAQTVYDDKVAYFSRFPSRDYRLASGVRVTPSGTGATLRFDYSFAVGGGRGGSRSGTGWTELTVRRGGELFLITAENGSVY